MLPNDFNAFTTLKTIDVSQNAVLNETFFFETLAKMPNLKNVNAAYCQIRTLPSLIYTIEELNIEGNLITTLPIEALQIPIINLSSNPFLDLNALFTTAQMGNQVKELYLNYCKIKEIPITIAALKGLEILHLKGNNLYTLPKEISTLKKLKVLDLSNEDNYVRTNRIESLPSTIGQLSQLETLNLRANNLTSLPKEFAQLQNLKTLNLSLNLLRTFPSSLYSLEKLQVLDLSFTEINRIPDEIENLTQLEYLNLTGNFFINYKLKINTLPETFGQLKLLKTLILKDNVIAILPNSFQNLTQLEYLDIKGNLLESLPENFGQIAQLKELDLKGNEIKMLPTSFSSLKKLEVLNLAFNFNIDTTSTEKTLLTMPQLKLVDISDCYFDKATVEKLRDKMPNTNFKVLNLVKK